MPFRWGKQKSLGEKQHELSEKYKKVNRCCYGLSNKRKSMKEMKLKSFEQRNHNRAHVKKLKIFSGV